MQELLATSEDGTSIAATDEGSGPTILIVHPGGQNETSWSIVASLLADDFRVVRIRRRIYAEDAADTWAGHTFAVEAADVLAVARLSDRPVFLVGHSSGAVAALEAALREPEAFNGVLVYEPPLPTRSLVGGEATDRAQAAIDAGDLVGAIRIHLRDIVGMPGSLVDGMLQDGDSRAEFTKFAAAQIADDQALDALGVGVERFRALDLPTVLVQGDRSPAHLLERTADLAAVLPDARVVTLPEQGHVAHLTAPHLLSAEIRSAAASSTPRA